MPGVVLVCVVLVWCVVGVVLVCGGCGAGCSVGVGVWWVWCWSVVGVVLCVVFTRG